MRGPRWPIWPPPTVRTCSKPGPGLGYYARARNLHKCAQTVVEHDGGVFPDSRAALLELPGIGPYTASAVAAIAFDAREAAVDGNVERVISRLFALDTPLPDAKPKSPISPKAWSRRNALATTPRR